MKGHTMTELNTNELISVEGGAKCAGIYIHLGDFAICVGTMTP
jgi:bacteriocin-like protein